MKRLQFEWDKLTLGSDNVLYRKTSTNAQVVLPQQLRRIIFKELHEDMGHRVVERVFDGKVTVLLATHEERYHTLCYQSLQMHQTKTTCGQAMRAP